MARRIQIGVNVQDDNSVNVKANFDATGKNLVLTIPVKTLPASNVVNPNDPQAHSHRDIFETSSTVGGSTLYGGDLSVKLTTDNDSPMYGFSKLSIEFTVNSKVPGSGSALSLLKK